MRGKSRNFQPLSINGRFDNLDEIIRLGRGIVEEYRHLNIMLDTVGAHVAKLQIDKAEQERIAKLPWWKKLGR